MGNRTKVIERLRKFPSAKAQLIDCAGCLFLPKPITSGANVLQAGMERDALFVGLYFLCQSLDGGREIMMTPFLFCAARRFDPLNVDAIVRDGHLHCDKESVEQAINHASGGDEKLKG